MLKTSVAKTTYSPPINISINIQVPDYFYCYKVYGKWGLTGDRYCDKLRIVNINFTHNKELISNIELWCLPSSYLYWNSDAEIQEMLEDLIGRDYYSQIYAFSQICYDDIFRQSFDDIEEYASQKLANFSAYIADFYLHPKYRNIEFETFIMDNMNEIMYYYCEWQFLCLSIFPDSDKQKDIFQKIGFLEMTSLEGGLIRHYLPTTGYWD